MTFKQALRLLQSAEKKARALQLRMDKCHVQFDNARAVIDHQYKVEWETYCEKNHLFWNYSFNDTIS